MPDVVSELLACGANASVCCQTSDSSTPMHVACQAGYTPFLQSVGTNERFGCTLCLSGLYSSIECVRRMFAAGVNINGVDGDRLPPINHALAGFYIFCLIGLCVTILTTVCGVTCIVADNIAMVSELMKMGGRVRVAACGELTPNHTFQPFRDKYPDLLAEVLPDSSVPTFSQLVKPRGRGTPSSCGWHLR